MSSEDKQSRYKDKSHTLGKENSNEEQSSYKKWRLLPFEERNEIAEKEMMFEGEKWWETGTWAKEMNKGGIVETSDFQILFPTYREMYFKQVWPLIQHIIEKQLHLEVTIDYQMGTIRVATTNRTFDPFAIVSGRDMLVLLARGVNLEQAKQILVPGTTYDVIKTKRYVRNYKVFMNRRQRLIGPNGATRKAIELLTNTHLAIQGKTVTAIGPLKGIKEVRRLVEDCMNNIHPIYHIKMLMVKRELEKNPKLANENWNRFLPNFKKTVSKKKKLKKPAQKEKKEYTPFPPPIEKSKVDIELETGQYFLSEAKKKKKVEEERAAKQKEKKIESMQKKLDAYTPKEKKEQQQAAASSSSSAQDSTSALVDKLKKKPAPSSGGILGKRKQEMEVIQDLIPSSAKKQKK